MSNDKVKVLMLSDHPLSFSGVGTQSRWLITGLLSTGRYTFRCFGAAEKHDNYDTIAVDPDFIIKPTNGFGNIEMLRHALVTEKPDVLLLFTDPRFFIWIWEHEDEIHQVCPIAYNHLWDNDPVPDFNRVLYESTDLINCINHPTYEMVKTMISPDRVNYIPHALPKEIFFPISRDIAMQYRMQLIGKERLDHFVAMWVSRNARRKLPSDAIMSFKLFLDKLEKKHGHRKASLIMHTDPKDVQGPDLCRVVDKLGMDEHVIFSPKSVEFAEMNVLYNIADVVMNTSYNEGFGLATLEAMQAGKPIITVKTGGLTRQVENPETGEQYGVGIDPEVRALVGNQVIPYIYEDYVSHETYSNAIMKVYEMGDEARGALGMRAREYALSSYSIDNLIKGWDESLTKLVSDWREKRSQRQTWQAIEI